MSLKFFESCGFESFQEQRESSVFPPHGKDDLVGRRAAS